MDGSSLSANTAMIGLLAVSGRAIDILWDLNAAPKDTTALINQALHTVRECRSSIQVLYKTLVLVQAAQLPFPERGAWIQLDEVIATLTDTVLAFSRLQVLFETLEQDAALTSLDEACARHARTIKSLSARIRFHSLSMTMMMTILKCRGQSDAKRSRAELGHRIVRLLTFNTNLAERLRVLEDVLNAKTSSGVELPDYATAQNAETGSPALGPAAAGAGVGQSLPVWSTFSGLSLMDIPVLPSICLPISFADLGLTYQFYAFAFAPQVGDEFPETAMASSRSSRGSILGLSGESWDTNGMANITRQVNNRAT